MEVDARGEPARRFEDRLYELLRGAGVGRRLQDDECPLGQLRADGLRRGADEGEVGLVVVVERRRNAQVDGVGAPQHRRLGGGQERPGLEHRRELGLGDVVDVARTRVQRGDPVAVDVVAQRAETLLGVPDCEWQAHVPEADDRDDRFA